MYDNLVSAVTRCVVHSTEWITCTNSDWLTLNWPKLAPSTETSCPLLIFQILLFYLECEIFETLQSDEHIVLMLAIECWKTIICNQPFVIIDGDFFSAPPTSGWSHNWLFYIQTWDEWLAVGGIATRWQLTYLGIQKLYSLLVWQSSDY
jgi:hypothetical protein